LAGSEKTEDAGTLGTARFAEGTAINLSLTSLGKVIECLAHNATNTKKKVVPYRDSKLTQMLQESLGGNSSTIMICAIRPGDKFFEETCNTLKYADRAKKIKNKVVKNESEADKVTRMLKEENEKLLA